MTEEMPYGENENCVLKPVDEDGNADGDLHLYEEEGAWVGAYSVAEVQERIDAAVENGDSNVEFFQTENNDMFFVPLDAAAAVIVELEGLAA